MSMSLQPPSKHDFSVLPVSNLNECMSKSTLSAIEQVGIGVACWDLDDRRIYWSEGLATLYGLVSKPDYYTYQSYLCRVHPEDRFQLKRLIKRMKTTLEVDQIEYRVQVDDQERWFRSHFSPGMQSGELTHIIEIVSDISDLKFAQQALIDSEIRAQRLLNCVSNVLIETTLSGEIVTVSDAVKADWGYIPDELRGVHLLSIVQFEGGLPLNWSTPVEPDWLPIPVTATVLHKYQAWHAAQCTIHLDPVRQTFWFVFQLSPAFHTSNPISPRLQSAIATVRNTLIEHHSFPTIYATISELLAYLLRADCVHIYQYHRDPLLWRNVYDYRQHPDLPCATGFEFPDRDNCISNSLRQLSPLRLKGCPLTGADPEPEFLNQFSGSWMILPILVDAKIWGSILVVRFNEDHQWTDQEFNQAVLFRDYITLAINKLTIE